MPDLFQPPAPAAQPRGLIGVYFNGRMATRLVLGFASGLPYLLTNDALQAWMKTVGVDLATIGLFSLVGLPYTLKFLWAPLMDRYVPPLLGRRRGWLLVTQLVLVGLMVSMLLVRPEHDAWTAAAVLLGIAIASASQDVVGDAYRTDLLTSAERGAGAAVWVTGYRIAMIGSGFLAFFLVGNGAITWPQAYALMGGLMMIGITGTLLAPEPNRRVAVPSTLVDAVVDPLREFFRRRDAGWVLVFILLFTLPDVLAKVMTVPFLLDIGITQGDIATVRQGIGVGVTIAGTFVGGAMVARAPLHRLLWLFGILQAVSNLGFLVLAKVEPTYAGFLVVTIIENFCGGLVTAGFVAFLMSQCDHRYSATHFAALSSIMRITTVIGGAWSGYLAKHLGWPVFFALTIAAAVPGLILIPMLRDPREAEQRRGFEVVTP